MSVDRKHSFLIFTKGGVPLYSYPRMDEKQNLFSSLVSAISAIGGNVFEKQTEREKLEFGDSHLFLLEKHELIFGLISQRENDKEGWKMLETLANNFLTQFRSDPNWLSTNITAIRKFDDTAKAKLEKQEEFLGNVDELLKEAEGMIKDLEEERGTQASLIEKASKIANEVGIVTAGYLARELSIEERDLYKVVLPRLELRSSQETDTFYSPSFWMQQKAVLQELLEKKKKLTLPEIGNRLDIQKSDISQLLKEVDTIKKGKTVFYRSLLQEAQEIINTQEQITLSSLATKLEIAPKEVSEIILPHLNQVFSQKTKTLYSKKFWESKIHNVKELIQEGPASLETVSKHIDVAPSDIQKMVSATELILFNEQIYFNRAHLIPHLKDRVEKQDLQSIASLLNTIKYEDEATAVELMENILPTFKEKIAHASLDEIDNFFKQLWQMEDVILLKIVKEFENLLKEKLSSASLPEITHFIDEMNYTSLRASSKLFKDLKHTLLQEERYQSSTVSAAKNFLHHLSLANKKVAHDAAKYVSSSLGNKKIQNTTPTEIGWLLHWINVVNHRTALKVVNEVKASVVQQLKNVSLKEVLSFLKTVEEFPEGATTILEFSQEDLFGKLSRSSKQEKYEVLDFLKTVVKPHNKKLYDTLKERIMDHIYFEK